MSIRLLLVTIVYHYVFLMKITLSFKRYHFQSNARTAFSKPPEVKCKSHIISITTSELNKFVYECKNIQNRFKSVSDDENEEDFSIPW